MKLLLLIFTFFSLCGFLNAQLKDQDSNSYNTVVIGNRSWMAENFRAVKLTNGQKIAFAKDLDEWMEYFEKKQPCYTYFDFDAKNKNYGLIYNFYAAHSNLIAPKDWKMPNTDDWDKMVFSVGKYDTETALKLKHGSTWKNRKNNMNSTGFSAKPLGKLKFCGAFTDPTEYPSVGYWRIDMEEEENEENACSFSISESGKMDLAQSFTGSTAGYYIRLFKLLSPDDADEEKEVEEEDE